MHVRDVMRQDSFPTFRRIGRWIIKVLKQPAVRKTYFAVGGVIFVGAWQWLVLHVVGQFMYMKPWHLYLYAVGGFGAVLLGAWGLKHRGAIFAYALGLGLTFGGNLFAWHGAQGMRIHPVGKIGCELMGDSVAGVLFFVLSIAGGYVGSYLAGVPVSLRPERLTKMQTLQGAFVGFSIVGFWVALYYLRGPLQSSDIGGLSYILGWPRVLFSLLRMS